MKKHIVYDEKEIIRIDRESLHREMRNVLAEQNLSEEYRIFLEMLEDMYTIAKAGDDLLKLLESPVMIRSLPFPALDRCRGRASESDALLEKWEQRLLHKR